MVTLYTKIVELYTDISWWKNQVDKSFFTSSHRKLRYALVTLHFTCTCNLFQATRSCSQSLTTRLSRHTHGSNGYSSVRLYYTILYNFLSITKHVQASILNYCHFIFHFILHTHTCYSLHACSIGTPSTEQCSLILHDPQSPACTFHRHLKQDTNTHYHEINSTLLLSTSCMIHMVCSYR